MALTKLLAFYTVCAMITGVITMILLVNKNFNIQPTTAVSALLLAVPVLAFALIALGNKSQSY